MNLALLTPLLDQVLGQTQHHAYLFICRSFAGESTPVELIAELLKRLAGITLFEPSQKPSVETFWQAFARHPDLARADSERAILRKDDVEIFRERTLYPPTFARRRFLLIERAERMNNQSANSLLKTLEEPLAECVFVLTTSRPSALPSTIASRCQKILLPAWEENQSALQTLEKEDLLFLENIFSAAHLKTPPVVVAVESLASPQLISISAKTLNELSQWCDQVGRRYSSEILRDALVENTSKALKAGELSQARSRLLLGLLHDWTETDPLNPTNSFWLMRILLTLAN